MKARYIKEIQRGKRETLPDGSILIRPDKIIWDTIELKYFTPVGEDIEENLEYLVLRELEEYLRLNSEQLIELSQDAHDRGMTYLVVLFKKTNSIVVLSSHDIYPYDIATTDPKTAQIIKKDLEHLKEYYRLRVKITNSLFYD